MSGKLTWFALYTRPRFEQKVNDNLQQMGFESYLPTQKVLKQWSDRKKWVEEPLFRSYCFVRIIPELYTEPLKAFGVVKYIWLDGKPAPVRDREIETIRLLCNSKIPLQVIGLPLEKGQKVCVTEGSLKGLSGEYIKNSGQHKILIRIDSISHGLLVTVPSGFIVAC
jgi:transcriptional antiterminator RfaH